MRSLLTEVERIKQMIGIPLNEMAKPSEQYIKSIQTILSANGLLKKEAESLFNQIIELADDQIINFDLLEHGVRNTLLKKGDKYKSIVKYLEKVLSSLKDREPDSYEIEPEQDDYSFEPEEPSILKKKVFRKELYYLQVELLKLQEWLMETGKTVIIVFEGRDSAGKGSTIKKFTENLNPRYYNIIALGIPSPEERQDWFGRYKKHIKPGMINFFDRSWYNRGLVEPVMGYGTEEEYENFMDNVENFENELVEKGDYLFKLWFSIDKETQARRFEMRQKSPLKYWKYSPNDAKMQDMWERFTEFKQRLFDKTSTMNHPWIVLDANDKKVSGLNAIRYVLQNIPYENKNEELLDKEFPEAMTVLRPETNEDI
jgi:polyphosphate kinase 2